MMDRKLVTVLAGTYLLCFGVGDALAQALPPRGETVETRRRPEIDPLGVRVRSFLFFPKIQLEEEYNDNVFATENDREDDFITRVMPSLTLESDWSRHFFRVSSGAEFGLHAHNQNEDYTDYFAETEGRLDVTRDINLGLGGGYARIHEERGDPDATAGRNPTEIDRYRAFAAYDQNFGLFGARVEGNFLRLDYMDDDISGPGEINNDDRDRNIFEGSLRASYEVLPPDYEAFIQFGGNRRKYDETPDDTGFERDSYGWDARTGIALDLGGLVFGEGYIGYFDQIFDEDDSLDDVDGLTYGLTFDWNVTPLTTVNIFGDRTVRETTQNEREDGRLSSASAALRSSVGVGVDHELLRNLILGSDFVYFNDDFEGIDREDDNLEFGLGARYFVNRNLYLNADYGLRRRLSNTDGNGIDGSDDFLENSFRISVEAQL